MGVEELAQVNQSEAESSVRNGGGTELSVGNYIPPGRDVKNLNYPDENTFVYKSHRKNIKLAKPTNKDAFRNVSNL